MTDTHEELRTQTRDHNRFRNERREAGEERFDVWLPPDIAAWLREKASSQDRTPNFQIRAFIRELYTESVYQRQVNPGAHPLTDAWERLAP